MKRKRVKLLTIILTVCMIVSMQGVAFAAAGMHTFKGNLEVIDSITGERIPNVSISLVDADNGSAVKYTRVISRDGDFKITNIVPGEYGWVLTVGGYTPSKMKVSGMSALEDTDSPQVKDLGHKIVDLTEKGKSRGDAGEKAREKQDKEKEPEVTGFGGKLSAFAAKFTSGIQDTFKEAFSWIGGSSKTKAADDEKEQGASISGKLYSADSKQSVTGNVTLYKDGKPAETDAVGFGEGYSFSGLKAGTYVVRHAAANNYSAARTVSIEIKDKDVAEETRITGKDLYLGAKGMTNAILSGTITVGDLPGDGTPTNDPVEVKLMQDGKLVKPVTCSADGSYLLTDVPAGTYALVAGGYGYEEETVVVQLSSGESLGGNDLHVASVKELSSIEITRLPDHRIYEEGELLDTTGLIVVAHYTDGSSKPLEDYDISGYGLEVGENVITVSYTEGGIEKEATFMVTALPKEEEDNNQGNDNNNGNNNNDNNNNDKPTNPPAAGGTDNNNGTADTAEPGGNAGTDNGAGAVAGTDPAGAADPNAANAAAATDPSATDNTDPTQQDDGKLDNAVQTSDESHVGFFWALLVICGSAMLISLLTGRKKKNDAEE